MITGTVIPLFGSCKPPLLVLLTQQSDFCVCWPGLIWHVDFRTRPRVLHAAPSTYQHASLASSGLEHADQKRHHRGQGHEEPSCGREAGAGGCVHHEGAAAGVCAHHQLFPVHKTGTARPCFAMAAPALAICLLQGLRYSCTHRFVLSPAWTWCTNEYLDAIALAW